MLILDLDLDEADLDGIKYRETVDAGALGCYRRISRRSTGGRGRGRVQVDETHECNWRKLYNVCVLKRENERQEMQALRGRVGELLAAVGSGLGDQSECRPGRGMASPIQGDDETRI